MSQYQEMPAGSSGKDPKIWASMRESPELFLTDEQKKEVKSLPRNLMDALDALAEDHDYLTAGGVFPERLLTQLIGRCRKASSRISRLPHPAEFAEYYDL